MGQPLVQPRFPDLAAAHRTEEPRVGRLLGHVALQQDARRNSLLGPAEIGDP
jgi:hypothetical protein